MTEHARELHEHLREEDATGCHSGELIEMATIMSLFSENSMETAGLDVMDYDDRWGRYRIRLTPADLKKQTEVITQVLTQAFNGANA